MPNYVSHHLTITGPEEERNRFMAECFTDSDRGPQFDFDRLIPQPGHIKESLKRGSTFNNGDERNAGDLQLAPGLETGFPE